MEMSFAQALNEAKAVILQQSNRIKADAEKIKQQQQTIVDQCSIITDHEMKTREQSAEMAKLQEQQEQMEVKLAQTTVAREQAEAVVDRQGQRLTGLQEQVDTFEKKLAEQSEQIAKLTDERDDYKSQLPSNADEAALAEMAALLSTKRAPVAATKDSSKDNKGLRIAGNRAEAA
jgi:chromosome segregation ATPase